MSSFLQSVLNKGSSPQMRLPNLPQGVRSSFTHVSPHPSLTLPLPPDGSTTVTSVGWWTLGPPLAPGTSAATARSWSEVARAMALALLLSPSPSVMFLHLLKLAGSLSAPTPLDQLIPFAYYMTLVGVFLRDQYSHNCILPCITYYIRLFVLLTSPDTYTEYPH